MSTTYTHDHVFAAGEVGCTICWAAHREDCDCERCQPVQDLDDLELAERLGLDAGEVIGAAQRAAADPFEPPIPGHGWSQDVHAEYARRSTTLILERIADAWLTC